MQQMLTRQFRRSWHWKIRSFAKPAVIIQWAQIKAISEFARTKGLKVHLDGARLFNAFAETGDRPEEIGKYFDTVSICLSKGLGAPVGSVLVCKKSWKSR